MKLLIVNADDFGWTEGVNCGIVEAHRTGLLGEMLARTYYESQNKPIYALREIKSRREAGDSTESPRPSRSSER